MLKKDSIYALNKANKEAIVYKTADGTVITLTRNDFQSEEEFKAWKDWSDNDFHEEENQDHIQSDHTVPLCEAIAEDDSTPPPDIAISQRIEKEENQQYAAEIVIRIRTRLSEKQFNRLWLYFVEKKTVYEIAASEGVTHQMISKSILSAKKKISKIFSKQVAKLPKNPR